jgi:hypothetical protein
VRATRDDYTARYSWGRGLEALEEAQRQRAAALQASKPVRSFVSSVAFTFPWEKLMSHFLQARSLMLQPVVVVEEDLVHLHRTAFLRPGSDIGRPRIMGTVRICSWQ